MSNGPFHLNDKVCLITGASSGIGQQIAMTASEMGARVILNGRDEARLNETMSKLKGDGHQLIAADLLDPDARKGLVDALDGIDGLVHCAGVVKPYPIKFIDQEKLDETMNINYEVPVLLSGEIVKAKKLNKNASVVFMSSISAQHPHKGGSMYAASKSAIEAFSKVFALEHYLQGVRSNCLSPAMVKTNMYDEAEKGMSKESMDDHIDKYPLGVGLPEDVANAAVFLLSDASRWITGINIRLDGGLLLNG